MSCRDCEAITGGEVSYPVDGIVYVRVGNGNVEIVGCRKHQLELLEVYRRGLDIEQHPAEAPPALRDLNYL